MIVRVKSAIAWCLGGATFVLGCTHGQLMVATKCEAMSPTLNCSGRWWERDICWVHKRSWTAKVPVDRGDVVLFHTPVDMIDGDVGRLMIGRVVGVGGDVIRPLDGSQPVRVPWNSFWLRADNETAADQSSEAFGVLHRDDIVGPIKYCLWPSKRMRRLKGAAAQSLSSTAPS